MADIQNLLKMLQSNDHNKRYDACEQLRVSPSLPLEARDALELASNDVNLDVADAAKRALAMHTEIKRELGVNYQNIKEMEQKHYANKARDIAIGFFGWFLVGSLIVLISNLLFNVALLAVTVIAIGILLFMKRNWLMYGIVAAVIANSFVYIGLGFDFILNWYTIWFSLKFGTSAPFFMSSWLQ